MVAHLPPSSRIRSRPQKIIANPSALPLSLPQNLACGAVARIAQILSMYPLDTIKVRIQVSRTTAKSQPFLAARKAILRGSLYTGAGFSLLGQVPYGMLTFGLYETLRTTLRRRVPDVPEWAQIILAASAGDALGSLWLTPSEVIKSKTQAGVYPTPVAAIRATAAQGPFSFYQGYTAAIARDIPFRAIQLTLYERLRSWYAKKKGSQLSAVENLLVGAIAGTFTAASTTPLDVVRTRMMGQAAGASATYANAFDCVVKTVSKEGLTALFKGIVPRCMLIGPSSAVFFLAYEASKTFFRSRNGVPRPIAHRAGQGQRGIGTSRNVFVCARRRCIA